MAKTNLGSYVPAFLGLGALLFAFGAGSGGGKGGGNGEGEGGDRKPPDRGGGGTTPNGGKEGGGDRKPPDRSGGGTTPSGGDRTAPNRGGGGTTPSGGDRTAPNRGGGGTTPSGGDRTAPNRGGGSTTPSGADREAPPRTTPSNVPSNGLKPNPVVPGGENSPKANTDKACEDGAAVPLSSAVKQVLQLQGAGDDYDRADVAFKMMYPTARFPIGDSKSPCADAYRKIVSAIGDARDALDAGDKKQIEYQPEQAELAVMVSRILEHLGYIPDQRGIKPFQLDYNAVALNDPLFDFPIEIFSEDGSKVVAVLQAPTKKVRTDGVLDQKSLEALFYAMRLSGGIIPAGDAFAGYPEWALQVARAQNGRLPGETTK